jgi:broad specificity phosphatase PhoE
VFIRLGIHLIRHGQTEWSISGQHTSHTDIPLTEQDRGETRELRQIFFAVKFLRVLTSPRQRAQETCKLARPGPQAEIRSELAEWDCGDYEYRRSTNIQENRPNWDIFESGCPRGETPRQVSNRADRYRPRARGSAACRGRG